MAHPRGGFASTVSRSNWNLEMLVFEEREDPEYPEKKPLGAETRTNNKLNPHLMLSPSIEPRPHWWEASTFTIAPSLLPFSGYREPQFNKVPRAWGNSGVSIKFEVGGWLKYSNRLYEQGFETVFL